MIVGRGDWISRWIVSLLQLVAAYVATWFRISRVSMANHYSWKLIPLISSVCGNVHCLGPNGVVYILCRLSKAETYQCSECIKRKDKHTNSKSRFRSFKFSAKACHLSSAQKFQSIPVEFSLRIKWCTCKKLLILKHIIIIFIRLGSYMFVHWFQCYDLCVLFWIRKIDEIILMMNPNFITGMHSSRMRSGPVVDVWEISVTETPSPPGSPETPPPTPPPIPGSHPRQNLPVQRPFFLVYRDPLTPNREPPGQSPHTHQDKDPPMNRQIPVKTLPCPFLAGNNGCRNGWCDGASTKAEANQRNYLNKGVWQKSH